MDESSAVPLQTVPVNKANAKTNTIAGLPRRAGWPIGFR
jgi:hypothetical protein